MTSPRNSASAVSLTIANGACRQVAFGQDRGSRRGEFAWVCKGFSRGLERVIGYRIQNCAVEQ